MLADSGYLHLAIPFCRIYLIVADSPPMTVLSTYSVGALREELCMRKMMPFAESGSALASPAAVRGANDVHSATAAELARAARLRAARGAALPARPCPDRARRAPAV